MTTASPASQQLRFHSDGRDLKAYLARPEGEGPFPGVVVIHEIFGLNDNIREVAGRFARAGYVAMAVDLFAGQNRAVCMARLLAGTLLHPLENGGVRDLSAALDRLMVQGDVDPSRLGAIGFCLGGGLALALACTDGRLKATAPYYGTNPRPLAAVRRSCPVVGSYPQRDFTAAGGQKLDAALDEYGVPHDIKVYQGTGHSFFNDHGPSFDRAASEDSWRRVMAFFKEYVAGEKPV